MKKITYSEPNDYLPKEIRDRFFGKTAAKKSTPAKKPTTVKKTAAKKKASK